MRACVPAGGRLGDGGGARSGGVGAGGEDLGLAIDTCHHMLAEVLAIQRSMDGRLRAVEERGCSSGSREGGGSLNRKRKRK